MSLELDIYSGKPNIKYISVSNPIETIRNTGEKSKFGSLRLMINSESSMVYLRGVIYLQFNLPSNNIVALQIKRDGKELYSTVPIDSRPQISSDSGTYAFPFEFIDKPDANFLNSVEYEFILEGICINGTVDSVGTYNISAKEIVV